MTRSLRHAPWVLALVLPMIAFLVIGRTVEIMKAELSPPFGAERMAEEPLSHLVEERSALSNGTSALAGLSK